MKNELAIKRVINDVKKLNEGFIKVLTAALESKKQKEEKKAA